MKRLLLALLLATPLAGSADEGMWTYDAFPSDRVARKYGFDPSAAWLDRARLASARLAGGCSASFVSDGGLIMTNHHCVHGCVEDLSSAGKDLVASGYLARSGAEELRCPAMQVDQLLRITDVTKRVHGALAGLEGARFNAALVAQKAAIEKECQGGDPGLLCELVELYHGGVYSLYQYRRYDDVRLVFAPEFAIAFFGGDPDNFMFPRYDLDVAFIRVYRDGKPAPTPDHFSWSPAGAPAGALTFVSGNPGKTERLLTVAQLEYVRDHALPDALERLAEERGLLTGFQLTGPEAKRVSTSRLFYNENSVKARRGQLAALRDAAFFASKVADENRLRAALRRDPAKARKYLPAWDRIAAAQVRARALDVPYDWLELFPSGRTRIGGDLFWMARHLVRAAEERKKPDGERLKEYRDTALPSLADRVDSAAPIDAAYETVRLGFWLEKVRERLGTDHAAVKHALGTASPAEVARKAVAGTALRDPAVRKALWEGGAAAVEASKDPLIALARATDADARAIRTRWEDEVDSVETQNQALIAQARFAVYGRTIYPDATFSPRLSYGQVKGWKQDGHEVPPFTTFAGAFERHTGSEPYALPKSWLDAKPRLDLATPLDFVTDNDIIGGNSGSPVFDRDLRIVGLAFDGNLASLGGDYGFDDSANRAVAVHSSAIVHALQRVYGADRLVSELGAGPAGTAGAATPPGGTRSTK
ncbi:S46 family peptidase [Anaeromyxobacter sp. Red801]|uniref:S46 family peptidase n=1 Tax=Anaeromyxobacter sp. Red801 TaxID=3411632 RepID=UPI003BA30241